MVNQQDQSQYYNNHHQQQYQSHHNCSTQRNHHNQNANQYANHSSNPNTHNQTLRTIPRNRNNTNNNNSNHTRTASGCSNVSSISCTTHRSNISGLTTANNDHPYNSSNGLGLLSQETDDILKGAEVVKLQIKQQAQQLQQYHQNMSSISIDMGIKIKIENNDSKERPKSDLDILKDIQTLHRSKNQQQHHQYPIMSKAKQDNNTRDENQEMIDMIMTRKQQRNTNATAPKLQYGASPLSVLNLYINQSTPPIQSTQALSYLEKDEAYKHVRTAGLIWQSIVGDFVRFPKSWYNGISRVPQDTPHNKWNYKTSERYTNHASLLSIVKHRTSRGRLLLHLLVLNHDKHNTGSTCIMDIVIGCLHPLFNQPHEENDRATSMCRHLWMGIRHRKSNTYPIEQFLQPNQEKQEVLQVSPIGGTTKKSINNSNIRFIFGDKPPLHTVRIAESDLISILQHKYSIGSSTTTPSITPSMAFLCEFVHRN